MAEQVPINSDSGSKYLVQGITKMMKIITSFIAAIVLAFFTVSSIPAQATVSEFPRGYKVNLRVMSYNIHHGVGVDNVLDLQRIADLITEKQADVVGIQEVDRHYGARSNFKDQAKVLAKMLGYHYVYGANLDLNPAVEGQDRRQYGTAILSKYPIIQSQNYLLSSFGKEQRGLLEATVNVKGNHLQVYNTHLGLDVPQRLAQVNEINDILSKKETPAILMGDLNAEPGVEEVELLRTGGNLVDVFQDADNANTFPVKNPSKRIDYIFVSEGMKFSGQQVLQSTYSDHLPITVDLELERSAPYLNGN
ncbi:endonuclease/exonuclease/phosphatase family protein [Bacillus sp. REN3]|uniref:endonuclease/exonuclease/phosphatase family protein n=1 Tax=Bacillus sp. REN3 TaxID=2802440 RepID=UPI001FEF041A|nr:endonuclease/exonuclease/phosphatase family protein [Bacillus sp. REN3]